MWHLTLYHIENGEYETALELCEKEVKLWNNYSFHTNKRTSQISPRCNAGRVALALNDACATLYRLQMEGVLWR
jgi:hypothetical protein